MRTPASTLTVLVVTLLLSACGSGGGASFGAPTAPDVIAVVPGDGRAVVTFAYKDPSTAAGDGVTSYNLYYDTSSPVGIGQQAQKIANAASPYVLTGLANDTTYYFVLTAVNAAGESTRSAEVSALPLNDSAYAVAAGSDRTCAALASKLVCFGDNGIDDFLVNGVPAGRGWGALGATDGPATALYLTDPPGVLSAAPYPVAVSGGLSPGHVDGVIAVGRYHTCAIDATGRVYCWGSDDTFQLGSGLSTEFSTSPVLVPGVTGAVQVAAGDAHSCARTSTAVYCWGANVNGQIGNGRPTPGILVETAPVLVIGITNPISISASVNYTCAVTRQGSVLCWGQNDRGQLGNGSTADSLVPVIVSGITTAVAVAAGPSHACALLVDGSVRCWGDNSQAQLGNGSTTSSLTPVGVLNLNGVVSVASGLGKTCAVLATGGISCWGHDPFTNTDALVATPIAGFGGTGALARTVAAGDNHMCALLISGGVQCWGSYELGQLGRGEYVNDQTNPKRFYEADFVSGLAAGGPGVTSIDVIPGDPSLVIGGSIALKAIGHTAGGHAVDLTTSVVWSMSPATTSVASVSNAAGQQGTVQGLAAGTATILAMDTYDNLAATTTIRVTVNTQPTITVNVHAEPQATGQPTNLSCLPSGQPVTVSNWAWHGYRDDGTPDGPGVFTFSSKTEGAPTATLFPSPTNAFTSFYVFCVITDVRGNKGSGYLRVWQTYGGAPSPTLAIGPPIIHAGSTPVTLSGGWPAPAINGPFSPTVFMVQYGGTVAPANIEGYLQIPSSTWQTQVVFRDVMPMSLGENVPASVFFNQGAYRAQMSGTDALGQLYTITEYFQVLP